MTKWSRHASGSWSMTTVDVVVDTSSSPLEFEFAIFLPFHRALISTHRYRRVPALGSCYGVVVG